MKHAATRNRSAVSAANRKATRSHFVDSVYLLAYRRLQDHHEAGERTLAVFSALDADSREAPSLEQRLLEHVEHVMPETPQPTSPLPPLQLPVPEPWAPLWLAVAHQQPAHRRVLILRFGQGLTNQQLARVLNRSETATLGLTQRALQAVSADAEADASDAAPPAVATEPTEGGQLSLISEPSRLQHLAERLRATAPPAPMDPLLRDAVIRGASAAGAAAKPGGRLPAGPLALQYSRLETAVGALLVAYRGDTVHLVDLGVPNDLFERQCTARLGERPAYQAAPPGPLARALQATIERRERFTGKVDLTRVPTFQRAVLLETLKIRSGEIRSYGWLARAVGSPGAARAVGTSMAHNPIPVLIPCHRVVRSDYHIGEYGCGGPTKKRELLAYEGVDVDRLERLAKQGIRYLGSATTKIFCVPGCYTGRRVKPQYERTFTSEDEARSSGFRPCKVCRPA